jgi:hypothetical protein
MTHHKNGKQKCMPRSEMKPLFWPYIRIEVRDDENITTAATPLTCGACKLRVFPYYVILEESE